MSGYSFKMDSVDAHWAYRAAQQDHLARLQRFERYPACTFTNPDSLAAYIALTIMPERSADDDDNSTRVGRSINDVTQNFFNNTFLAVNTLPGKISGVIREVLHVERENSVYVCMLRASLEK